MSDFSARTAVIVDGHPLWLDALERLLDRLDLQVVGRATLARDAEQLIEERQPDLVVTDYAAMNERNGGASAWKALARARELNPEIRCVVLSEADDPSEREHAFASGADVFCVKRTEPDDLMSAIRQSFDNSIFFARADVPSVEATQAMTAARDKADGLTKREVEILRLVAEGHSNSQLARMLWVTEQTVKFHLSNIYRKLDVANRTEASRWAQLNGLLEVRDTEPAAAA